MERITRIDRKTTLGVGRRNAQWGADRNDKLVPGACVTLFNAE